MYDEIEKPIRELALDEALERRARAMTDSPAPTAPNGIKLVRVTSLDKPNDTATVELHFFNHNYLAEIGDSVSAPASIFTISGGTRIRGGTAAGQVQVTDIVKPAAAEPVLELAVKPIGDYSTYKLSIVAAEVINPPGTPNPPGPKTKIKIDPLFAEISFKFRPGCFNTNCAPEWNVGLPPFDEPVIDYVAKDYASFRQTMIAAMGRRIPGWQPSSEADLDLVLAELFAVAADELSDYQDRVMNEAYIASARKRVSLARHARLMDYHIHQGNQASSWLALEIEHDTGQKGFLLKQGLRVWAGESEPPLLDAQTDASVVFMTRHKNPQSIHQYLNNVGLYTWSGSITTLKAGSTRADLKLYRKFYLDDPSPPVSVITKAAADEIRDLIRQGRIKYLLIQEHLNPETGRLAGRDPSKRQLLRLKPGDTGAESIFDPVNNEWMVRVRWEKQDALKRDYCFTINCPADNPGTKVGSVDNISLFHGNLVEIFHGRETTNVFRPPDIPLNINPALPLEFHYERTGWGAICRLHDAALAYKATEPGGDVPPVSTLRVTVSELGGGVADWDEKPNLIHSDDSSENGDHFVVETDENRRSIIRFGNGRNGMELPDDATVTATYQSGMPLDGNLGADMITHFDPLTVAGEPPAPAINLRTCWNPFDLLNGRDPEPVAEIIRRVPEAYRYRQLRAVTLADYVARAEEIKGVSRAAARYAWTGSWRTVQVAIDPVGTNELSYSVRKQVEAYLNAVRLIGEDLEVRPPRFVPLEIKVKLCAEDDVWPEDIKFVLEQEFSDSWTPDGRMGFFHPDLWTFGQPLYASQIIGRALKVEGVKHAVAYERSSGPPKDMISVYIKRWNSPFAPADSITALAHNEVIMVENDPDHMEKGVITFEVRGGRQ